MSEVNERLLQPVTTKDLHKYLQKEQKEITEDEWIESKILSYDVRIHQRRSVVWCSVHRAS